MDLFFVFNVSLNHNCYVVDDGELDDTWEILDHTIDGNALLYPQMAFRRRKHSKRIDHICKVENFLFIFILYSLIFDVCLLGYLFSCRNHDTPMF